MSGKLKSHNPALIGHDDERHPVDPRSMSTTVQFRQKVQDPRAGLCPTHES